MLDLRVIFVVAGGAAIGGVLRLLITQFVVGRFGVACAFYATLFINVSGSFLIGVVIELSQVRADLHPLWRLFLATGVLGGYTTFSTFSYDAVTLASGGLIWSSVAYVAASVVLGIAGAILGVACTRALSGAA